MVNKKNSKKEYTFFLEHLPTIFFFSFQQNKVFEDMFYIGFYWFIEECKKYYNCIYSAVRQLHQSFNFSSNPDRRVVGDFIWNYFNSQFWGKICAGWGDNFRTHCWIPEVKEAIGLDKEAFWVWLAGCLQKQLTGMVWPGELQSGSL